MAGSAIDFTYQMPITTDRDRVRFLVGDTNVNRPLLDDGEIAYSLTLGDNHLLRSAAHACDAIAAKFIRDKSVSVSGISITRNFSASEYKDLATEYRRRAKSLSSGSLWILKDPQDKSDFRADASLVPPAFSREMHDNKAGTGSDDFKSASC